MWVGLFVKPLLSILLFFVGFEIVCACLWKNTATLSGKCKLELIVKPWYYCTGSPGFRGGRGGGGGVDMILSPTESEIEISKME